MPRSKARCSVAMDSASSAGPYTPDMLMQPRPIGETLNSVVPNWRYSMRLPPRPIDPKSLLFLSQRLRIHYVDRLALSVCDDLLHGVAVVSFITIMLNVTEVWRADGV